MKFLPASLPALCILIAVCAPLFGQSQPKKPASVVGDGCDLKSFGEKDTRRFLNFDRSLRQAIAQRDTARLAALVLFPLRVNDADGSIFIHNARSLEGEYDRIFTEKIRKAILDTTLDSVGCNYSGIEYGDYQVWVNVIDKGFFLVSVNLHSGKEKQKKQSVDLACYTDTKRVVIDRSSDDSMRYRAWKLDQALDEKPAVEIGKGTGAIEGTGPCAHWEWNFSTATGSMLVMEPGCYGEVEPPHGGQAEIVVNEKGGKVTSTWCF